MCPPTNTRSTSIGFYPHIINQNATTKCSNVISYPQKQRNSINTSNIFNTNHFSFSNNQTILIVVRRLSEMTPAHTSYYQEDHQDNNYGEYHDNHQDDYGLSLRQTEMISTTTAAMTITKHYLLQPSNYHESPDQSYKYTNNHDATQAHSQGLTWIYVYQVNRKREYKCINIIHG